MSVIAALEFENEISFGGGAGDAQSAHDGFRAGRNEAQHLNPWQPRCNPFSELERVRFTRPEAPGGVGCLSYSLADVRIEMAENQRTKTLAEIYVLATIDRSHGCALCTAKENRRAPDAFERTHGTVNTARRNAKCAIELFA